MALLKARSPRPLNESGYMIASRPVPPSGPDPRSLCARCGKLMSETRSSRHQTGSTAVEILAARVYRLARDERRYGHAECMDSSWHWSMAVALTRATDFATGAPLRAEWPDGERAARTHLASAALHVTARHTGSVAAWFESKGVIPELATGMLDLLVGRRSDVWLRAYAGHAVDLRRGMMKLVQVSSSRDPERLVVPDGCAQR